MHAEPSHWLHEISMFQNRSSPFLALINTPIINWGYLFYREQQKSQNIQRPPTKEKQLGPFGECWFPSLLHHFWPRLMVAAWTMDIILVGPIVSLLIRWLCLPRFFFFFGVAISHFDWLNTQGKIKKNKENKELTNWPTWSTLQDNPSFQVIDEPLDNLLFPERY